MLKSDIIVDMRDKKCKRLSSASFKEKIKQAEVENNENSLTIYSTDSNPGKKLEQYKLVRSQNKGGIKLFGVCQKVGHRDFRLIRVFNKSQMLSLEIPENSIKVKKVMSSISKHQFIVKIDEVFLSYSKLCYIMELVEGGELKYHLSRYRRFSEDTVKFFVACIVLAIGHVHSNTHNYGDIHLDNILIDSDGYPKLASFGNWAFLERGDSMELRTLGYLSPEVITEDNSTPAMDWWALGILTYELFFGFLPFTNRNPETLLKIIKKGHIVFPEKYPLSSEGRDFISSV